MKIFKFATTFLCTCAAMLFVVLCVFIYGSITSDQQDTPKKELSQQQTELTLPSDAKSNLYKGDWHKTETYNFVFEEINYTKRIGDYVAKSGHSILEIVVVYENKSNRTATINNNNMVVILDGYEVKPDANVLLKSQNQSLNGIINAGNKARGYYYFIISNDKQDIKIQFKTNSHEHSLSGTLPGVIYLEEFTSEYDEWMKEINR